MKQPYFLAYFLFPACALLGAFLLLMLPALPRAEAVVPSLPADVTPTRTAVASTALPTPTLTPTPLPTPTPTPMPTSTPIPTPLLPTARPFFQEEVPTPTPHPLPDAADVPILMYHYVEELPPNADSLRRGLTVTPDRFEAQLQYLAEAGYHTITLADLHHHLFEGLPLPEKPIILTFDDGYRDAYTIVFPLLQKYGFVGTFFVLATPAHFENPNYLTWDMMAEMAAAGMEIEGHGRDHVDLRNRSYDYLVYQILGIKEAVEYHTGQPVRFFCYPSGQYDAAVLRVVQGAGYWGAVTTQYGRIHTRENIYTLSRIRIRGSDTLEDFIARIETP